MKAKHWKVYAFWIALAEAVGGLSAWLTRGGMAEYMATVRKPPLSPPEIVFPIVWGILFALMGIGAARVSLAPPSRQRSQALGWFALQLAANFLWTILFFGFLAFGTAFFWLIALWLLILAMILSFRRVDPLAGNLQIPYLLWVSFAAFLNYGVWFLNR